MIDHESQKHFNVWDFPISRFVEEGKEAMAKCRLSVEGAGHYYGHPYDPEHPVVLTVPLVGESPRTRRSSAFSIVRVGASPQEEWGERLLIDSGVIGWLDEDCHQALLIMASQTDGRPEIVDSGILPPDGATYGGIK